MALLDIFRTKKINPNSLANLKQNRLPPEEGSSKRSSDEDFIDKMQRYERLRQDIYNTEQQKRQSIMEELQESMADQDEDDEGIGDGEIIKMFTNIVQGSEGTTTLPTSQTSHSQSAPQGGVSDDDIRNIIAAVETENPKIIKRVRNGSISRDQAISFLKLKGVPELDAARIYEKAVSDDQ